MAAVDTDVIQRIRERAWFRTQQIQAVAFLFAVGAAAFDASAQEFTGSIYGRIVDPANAVLPGVSITIEGPAIQGQRTALSEANGSYRVLYLPQGEYRV